MPILWEDNESVQLPLLIVKKLTDHSTKPSFKNIKLFMLKKLNFTNYFSIFNYYILLLKNFNLII